MASGSCWGKGWLTAVVALAALASVPCRASDTVTLDASRDNTLFSNLSNSGGAGPSIFSGRTGELAQPGGIIQRALIKFDTCLIPRGSTIESAVLTIYVELAITGDQTHTLHKVLQDWGEGTSIAKGGSGSPATEGDATWELRFFPGMPWDSPGGDYVLTGSGSAIVGFAFAPIPITWDSTPRMVADMQSWVDDAATNFGWMIKGNEDVLQTAKKFVCREGFDPAFYPVLEVNFEPPQQVCPADCGGDAADGEVSIADLLALLGGWGMPGQSCDLNCDGIIDTVDLLNMLGAWGECGSP